MFLVFSLSPYECTTKQYLPTREKTSIPISRFFCLLLLRCHPRHFVELSFLSIAGSFPAGVCHKHSCILIRVQHVQPFLEYAPRRIAGSYVYFRCTRKLFPPAGRGLACHILTPSPTLGTVTLSVCWGGRRNPA